MRPNLNSALSVTIAATICVSGCAHDDQALPQPAIPALIGPESVTAPDETGPLPTPEVLSAVLYRLADTAVPGADKLSLVSDASPSDAAALDAFGAALRDDGFAPIIVTATDIGWSDDNTDRVGANITITPADPEDPRGFTFPMEFRPSAVGWQLTSETGDTLLALDSAQTGPAIPADSTPGR